jgi:hypothetical protein
VSLSKQKGLFRWQSAYIVVSRVLSSVYYWLGTAYDVASNFTALPFGDIQEVRHRAELKVRRGCTLAVHTAAASHGSVSCCCCCCCCRAGLGSTWCCGPVTSSPSLRALWCPRGAWYNGTVSVHCLALAHLCCSATQVACIYNCMVKVEAECHVAVRVKEMVSALLCLMPCYYAILYCAVLCCAVLCCAMLCCHCMPARTFTTVARAVCLVGATVAAAGAHGIPRDCGSGAVDDVARRRVLPGPRWRDEADGARKQDREPHAVQVQES